MKAFFVLSTEMHAFSIAAAASVVGISFILLVRSMRAPSCADRAHRDLRAVQSAHTAPTPRTGGVSVALALTLSILITTHSTADTAILLLLVATVPIFLFGLFEDIGLDMSPLVRLCAALVSSGIVLLIQTAWVTQTGVLILDEILAVAPIAIVLTLLWTTGVCHAFNLIDGVNGFMAALAFAIATGLCVLAWRSGDNVMLTALLAVMGALVGFLVFNFPKGLVFMGDAGAYAIGHVLAWSGILLVLRNDGIGGMAVALMFFWPVADTLLAIVRRRAAGRSPDQPDRLHMHQLVMRGLEILCFGRGQRSIANPMTTLVLLPIATMPVVVGVWLVASPNLAFLAAMLFAAAFIASYRLGLLLIRSQRRPLRAVFRKGQVVVIAESSSAAP